MPTQDEMTIDERRKQVKLLAPRYQQARHLASFGVLVLTAEVESHLALSQLAEKLQKI